MTNEEIEARIRTLADQNVRLIVLRDGLRERAEQIHQDLLRGEGRLQELQEQLTALNASQ